MAILSRLPGIEVTVVVNDDDPVEEFESSKFPSNQDSKVSIRHVKCADNTVARMRFRFSREFRDTEIGTEHEAVPKETLMGKINIHFSVFIRGEQLRRPLVRPCEQLHPRATPEFYIETNMPRTVSHRTQTIMNNGVEETVEQKTRRHRIMEMGDIVVFVYRSRTLFHGVGEEDQAVRTSVSQ
jgi:hypothetical protein